MSAFGNLPIKIAAGAPSAPEFNSITLYNDTNVLTMMRADSSTITFAPANPDYVTLSNQVAVIPNSFNLGSLTQGILRNQPSGGVASLIAINQPIFGKATVTGGTLTVSSDAITTSTKVMAASSNNSNPIVVSSVNAGNFVLINGNSGTDSFYYMYQN